MYGRLPVEEVNRSAIDRRRCRHEAHGTGMATLSSRAGAIQVQGLRPYDLPWN